MAGHHRGRRAVFYLNDPFRVERGLVIPASCSLPADGDQSSRRGGAPATGLLNFGPMGLGSICLASLRRVTPVGLSRPAGKVAGGDEVGGAPVSAYALWAKPTCGWGGGASGGRAHLLPESGVCTRCPPFSYPPIMGRVNQRPARKEAKKGPQKASSATSRNPSHSNMRR